MSSYYDSAVRAAKQYFKSQGDQDIFLRQMKQEAGFTDATSPAGAQGPAQIMPATAKGWGVKNVHDPNEAYMAAAKHMAAYLHEYGGDWAKALTAYNAGPGAVGRAQLPAETVHYIETILGGKGDAHSSSAQAAPKSTGGSSSSSKDAIDAALLDVLASHRHGRQRSHAINAALDAVPASSPVPSAPNTHQASEPGTQSGTKGHSPLYELFYDPLGGWKRSAGQTQSIGAIGGHGDHVHVAAGPHTLDQVNQLASRDGLTVTSTTGGKHAPHSFHYSGRARDYAGDPAAMKRFAQDVLKFFHVK